MLLLGFADGASEVRHNEVKDTPSICIHSPKFQIPQPYEQKVSENTFELFDGEIVVPSANKPTTFRTSTSNQTVKLNVFQKSSKAQVDLVSMLNENLDQRTVPVQPPKTASGKRRLESEPANTENRPSELFSLQDFIGIEKTCRNAGVSSEGLMKFVHMVKSAQAVALSVVWSDLSCNHATTTVKFCTLSTKCDHWNCTCDRQVRAHFAASTAVGLVLRLPSDGDTAYFLPLLDCSGSLNKSAGKSMSNSLPINCGTTLKERVSAMLQILSDPTVMKLMYHAQVALIPLLQLAGCHLQSELPACSNHFFCLSVVVNVFDPRLAAYMCDSDITEAQLELESMFEKHNTTRLSSSSSSLAGLSERSRSSWGSGAAAASAVSSTGSNRLVDSAGDLSVVGLGRVARAVYRVKADLGGILSLHGVLEQEMAKHGVGRIFREVEMPVACLLAQIELVGVAIDTGYLDQLRVILTKRINDIEIQIYASVGEASGRINVASPEQVSRLLFDTLGLPPPANSSKKGKHLSTSEEDLLKLQGAHPVVGLILQYRALAKVWSTYVDGVRPFLVKETSPLHELLHGQTSSADSQALHELDAESSVVERSNAFSVLMNRARDSALEAQRGAKLQERVHANWQQTIVRTGRLSCTKPNLQNIPNKQVVAGFDINVRSAFRASRG